MPDTICDEVMFDSVLNGEIKSSSIDLCVACIPLLTA